jgi:hypothetical protein
MTKFVSIWKMFKYHTYYGFEGCEMVHLPWSSIIRQAGAKILFGCYLST